MSTWPSLCWLMLTVRTQEAAITEDLEGKPIEGASTKYYVGTEVYSLSGERGEEGGGRG